MARVRGKHMCGLTNPKFGKLFVFSSCERLAFRAAVICSHLKVCPQQVANAVFANHHQSLQIIKASLCKNFRKETWQALNLEPHGTQGAAQQPVLPRQGAMISSQQLRQLAISRSIFSLSSWDGLPAVANPSVMPQDSLAVCYIAKPRGHSFVQMKQLDLPGKRL